LIVAVIMTYLPKHLVVLASLLATQAFAAHDMAAAQARYKHDLAECGMKNSPVDKRSCMKEARNALAEAKRGHMNTAAKSAEFERNALLRCDAHKGEDRADCVARMQGQGRTEGSVLGGGILRELATTKTLPAPVVPVEAAKAPPAPRPSGLMSNCRWVPPNEWVCI
jgi:hypothetical protein